MYLMACCLLILAAVAYLAAGSAHYSGNVTVIVEGQRIVGDSVVVSVLASNPGPGTLIWSDSPFLEARYEMDGVWTNSYRGRGLTMLGLLLPGEVEHGEFSLPRNATRCQVGGYFEYAGPRGAAAAHLMKPGWWGRLHPVSDWVVGLLPGGGRQVVESWSTEVALKTEH
jgi:hypothetical protein